MERTKSQERLAHLLDEVFADGRLDPDERDELRRLFSSGGLTVSQAKAVFQDFVERTWGEVMADGVVTDDERQKMETIIRELKLPADVLPPQVALFLDREREP